MDKTICVDVSIKDNLIRIKEQIGNINVKIIAVTKYANKNQILDAYNLGINDFGESYVQDALEKLKTNFPDAEKTENKIKWHFIGRLQKNKIKFVVGKFSLIHSVDSMELADKMNEFAKKNNIVQDILLQVNVSGEDSKTGFSKIELLSDFEKIRDFSSLKTVGFMTMAPKTDDINFCRSVFVRLSNLRKEINTKFNADLKELSMGMSNDYKIAIESGATMIRLGRAIFNFSQI